MLVVVSGNSSSALSMGEITDSNYIVKTDEPGALPALSEDQLEKALEKWLAEETVMKENALEFLPYVIKAQDTYKVNAAFLYSIYRKENGIATNKSGILGKGTNNIGSITTTASSNIPKLQTTGENGEIYYWKVYQSYGDAILDTGDYIANSEGMYFQAGQFDLKSIGQVYCQPPDEWINTIKGFIDEIYESAGVSINNNSGTTVANGGEGTIGVYSSSSGKKFNLYVQGDSSPWASNAYGRGGSNSATMAYAGCGPTAEAIIASGYNASITPETTRADIIKAHNGVINNYSSADEIERSLKRLIPGIKAEAGTFDETKIKNYLSNSGQVWLVVQYCKYTSGQHCIALIDYDKNKGVYVAHGTASNKAYGWEDLSYIKNNLNNNSVTYVGGN